VLAISTAQEIGIREFKPWLEKKAPNALEPLHEEAEKLIGKVQERLTDAREVCAKLAEEGSKELEKGKAKRKAKLTEKLCRYFLKQLDKISFPDKMSFGELDELHKDLEKTFSSITRERNVWFPRISPLFIIARKRVDFAFSRLAGPIEELSAFLSQDYSKAKLLEKLLSETDETLRLLSILDRYETRRANIQEKIQLLETKIKKDETTASSLRSHSNLEDLSEINRRVHQLKKQVRHTLRHLQKPLIKFLKLTRGPGYALSSGEVEKLGQYLQDPFVALANEEPGYPLLKSLLEKVDRAMVERKLRLKSSRLRKAQEDIAAFVNQNALRALHESCAQAFSSSKQLTSSQETKVTRRKLKQLERKLERSQKRREAVAVRLETLDEERVQVLQKLEEQKKMLEHSVHDFLGSSISLKL
jgi:hypothetical protein